MQKRQFQGPRVFGGPQSRGLGGPHVAESIIAASDVTTMCQLSAFIPRLFAIFIIIICSAQSVTSSRWRGAGLWAVAQAAAAVS